MYLESVLLVFTALKIVTAKQQCPENLSQNCICQDNNQTVQCTFKPQDSLVIFNSSYDQSSLINLTKLDISKNSLNSLPTNFLDGIQSLKELDLSENEFATLPTMLHSTLASTIQKLNLSFNVLKEVDDLTFSSMSALENLDISNNQLKTVKDNTFINNRYLWLIDLSTNNVDYLSQRTFQGLENSIRDLDMSRNNLLHLDKNTFSNLKELKSLKLSKTSETADLLDLKFPQHMVLMDLSLSGIKEIDDCRLLQMIDLEYLNLNGNPLTCSCHLLWLHQRLLHNQEMDSIHTVHLEYNNNWTCINTEGSTVKVPDLQIGCSGHYILNSPEHCRQSEEASVTFDQLTFEENLNLETEKGEKEVAVKWHGYNASSFYGYEITISNENGEKIYNSPTLHSSATKYTAQSEELKSGKYRVCLNVLYNETKLIGSACHEISYLDLQIIVGILAGVIFLIPCGVALAYIMCLDKRRFLLYDDYTELYETHDVKTKEKKVSENTEKTESVAKYTKAQKQKDKLAVPTIKVHDYTLSNAESSQSISKDNQSTIPGVRSTDKILSEDHTSIEPDGDSGSSNGIQIEIPNDDNETGMTNKGFSEDGPRYYDVKL